MSDHAAPALPTHHAERMSGRNPHESHRVATPLELLFDLTFVIAFGLAASQLAHACAEGHFAAGLIGFTFAMFAVCWAWINFSWFASAFDTDDWLYRLTTMVQMAGVLVLSLGLPQMFKSIEEGAHVDNGVMVLGYVIMRVAMIFQWSRAARQNPGRRGACMTYIKAVLIAQIGWVAVIFIDMPLLPTILCVVVLSLVEMAGPYIAERRHGGTPWHAHHIAERYSLLAIIALGEGVVGTVASIAAIVEEQGWSFEAVAVAIAGTALTFAMWWIYFIIPSADVLHAQRERSFVWGYGHIFVFAAIAATGAGLHVAAYFIEHKAHIGEAVAVATVAVPVGFYIALIFALYAYLLGTIERLYIILLVAAAFLLALSVSAAAAGADVALCLLVIVTAPAIIVVGYEVRGHVYGSRALERRLNQ